VHEEEVEELEEEKVEEEQIVGVSEPLSYFDSWTS